MAVTGHVKAITTMEERVAAMVLVMVSAEEWPVPGRGVLDQPADLMEWYFALAEAKGKWYHKQMKRG